MWLLTLLDNTTTECLFGGGGPLYGTDGDARRKF